MNTLNKDFFDWIVDILGIISIPGASATWLYLHEQSKEDGKRAMTQINKMATNDFPHMQATLLNMDKNIAKMSGGQPVDFTQLNLAIEAKKPEPETN